ncbi:DUF4422 domain-containing protein [Enorma massiliensis]|uniref:DUF4422 domain-containing protein n=2 Tax=Enorma massiliensis TaxID=1472761 RepID=UPI003AEFEF28
MKIYVASHAFCDMPHRGIYQPLFVGSYKLNRNDRRSDWEYDDGYLSNISRDNALFCELTGVKWIWKKSREDIVGLVHYRRFLASPQSHPENPSPLNEEEIRNILGSHDCIVATRAFLHDGSQNCTVAKHYRIHHSSTDLIKVKLIIDRYFPGYSDAFNEVMRSKHLSPFNIIVCKKQLFDAYASWLFSVEHKLAQAIDPISNRPPYQRRVFGFIAERLLNVFILKHNLSAFECPIFNPLDPTSVVPGMSSSLQATDIRRPTELEQLTTIRDGTDYSPVFSFSFYFNNYRDIADTFFDNPSLALDHFLINGINEGRTAHAEFSISSYVNGNPHLCLEYDSPIKIIHHYLNDENDRSHAIGYENLLSSPSPTANKRTHAICRYKELRFERWTLEAESKPVLDVGL